MPWRGWFEAIGLEEVSMLRAVVFGVALLAAAPAVAACTDASRACLIEAATAYLDGLQSRNPDAVPLAPDVRVTEQGRVRGDGIAKIRENIRTLPPLAGRANTRFFVDEKAQTIVVYTLLKIPAGAPVPGRPSPAPITDHATLRIKVERGLIREVEAIVFLETGTLDGTSGWPD
jgi:hypothetical protein